MQLEMLTGSRLKGWGGGGQRGINLLSRASGGSTVVDHSTHNPKIKGSNPVASSGRVPLEPGEIRI